MMPKLEQTGGGLVPVPDPTVLTTQSLLREVGSLKELIQARLDANDKAIILLQDASNRSPSINEVYVQHEERFKTIQEKFDSVANQLRERDTRTDQTRKADKEAIDAALLAASTAVSEQNKSNSTANAKTEANMSKQMDLIGTQIASTTKATDDKIADLKERQMLFEGQSKGKSEGVGMSATVVLSIFLALAAIAAVIGLIFEIATKH